MNRPAVSRTSFLKDVLICSLGAYGGPEAHYGVFTDQLVVKKHYLTEEELIELIALTGILPGPSSTQTLVAIGYKMGGPMLALLTMLVWALPVLALMTALSFTGQLMDLIHVSQDVLRYIGPMAVGFIAVAAYRIGRKVIRDRMTLALFLFGAVITFGIRTPWIFPAVLLIGAYAGGMAARGQGFLFQIAGAMTGGVAIFLPGLLLIFFIYPVWEKLRQIKGIKVALGGITAVAGGLIASAAVVLMQRSGFQPDHFLILIITALLLLSKKIPAPLIVLMVLGAGVIL
jgi:chromate transport protein ChrA